MGHKIICINRTCGSGGHSIGQAVAKELGIAYYDKNLIQEAIKFGGLENEPGFSAKKDERTHNRAFFKTHNSVGNRNVTTEGSTNDIIFQLQRDLLIEKSKEEDFVIVGRCGDRILDPETLDIKTLRCFVYAPDDFRVARIMKEDGQNRARAAMTIRRTDARRSDYYFHYTKTSWDDRDHYQMLLNSKELGIDLCIRLLVSYYRNVL